MTDEQHISAASDDATEEIQPLATSETGLSSPSEEGWFARLRARFSGSQARRTYTTERLIALTRAIERHPDSPVNYVLRGELYVEIGERALAVDDFQTALALAEAQYAHEDWGFVAQALQDRAAAGLARIR